jgi:hypothetical protein
MIVDPGKWQNEESLHCLVSCSFIEGIFGDASLLLNGDHAKKADN